MDEPEIRYRVPEGVTYERVDDGVVVVSIPRGAYFGLDEVASEVWSVVTAGGTVEQAVESILEQYDVGRAEARRDVLELVDRWLALELLVAPGAAPARA